MGETTLEEMNVVGDGGDIRRGGRRRMREVI